MIRVSVIGAGNIAARFDSRKNQNILTHAHAILKHPEFELAGFYDKKEQRVIDAVNAWGGSVFSSLEEAVRGADIVCCCLPDKYHAQMLLEVAKYKPKLIIMEKPLAVTYQDMEMLLERYDRKLPVLINYSRRFLPEFHKLKDEINSYGMFLKGVGYYGKGTIHNGSHMVDLLRFLLGEISKVRDLDGQIYDFTYEDPSKNLELHIKNGRFYMNAIDCRAVTIFEMELFFERARVRVLDGGERIEIYHVFSSNVYEGYRNYQLVEKRAVNLSGAMLGLYDNVANFLRGKAELCCKLEDGLEALKACIRRDVDDVSESNHSCND